MTDTQCNQVPLETCEQVPKQRCSSTSKEVCTNVSCWLSASHCSDFRSVFCRCLRSDAGRCPRRFVQMSQLRSASKYQSKSALRLVSYFFGCRFIAILYMLLSRSAGTSPRNIALRKWLVSSYDCRLLTSISFLQEHVQKRICSKATKKVTKRVLPKAEAPKQALPKEEAIKKVLPKATEAIRKVLSKASHSYKWWRREDCYTHDKFLLQPYLWNITKLLCSFLSCHWR